MTSTVHRILGFAGAVVALVSATLGGSNLIDPQVGAWLAAGGSMLPLIATLWRQYFPDSRADGGGA